MAGGRYRLYGLSVRSPLALPCPPDGRVADVTIRRWRGGRTPARPPSASRDWFWYRRLADGSAMVRWREVSEFRISADGLAIEWRRLPRGTDETFRGYLLSQILSFSLLARRQEPLHGSAVAVNGRVAAFVGDCGLGKSSLAAAFLQAGYPLVTDDLLVLSRRGRRYRVEPGVPRIKLAPRLARRLLDLRGPLTPMTPGATKAVIPVPGRLHARKSLPLSTLYVLARGPAVRIAPLAPAAAFLEIIRDAFNTVDLNPRRLARQFRFAQRLAASVRVRLLAYPRRWDWIERVRDAVLDDCGSRPVTGVTPGRRSTR